MLRARHWRRIVPFILVALFAIFVPIRANALSGFFESSWQRLAALFGRNPITGIFGNNGTEMDPVGKPAPSGVPTVLSGPATGHTVAREGRDDSFPRR